MFGHPATVYIDSTYKIVYSFSIFFTMIYLNKMFKFYNRFFVFYSLFVIYSFFGIVIKLYIVKKFSQSFGSFY